MAAQHTSYLGALTFGEYTMLQEVCAEHGHQMWLIANVVTKGSSPFVWHVTVCAHEIHMLEWADFLVKRHRSRAGEFKSLLAS